MSIATGFYVPSARFFIVIWHRLLKTVRSFCGPNVLLYFSFIPKTLSVSRNREREWNMRKIESDVVFVISLVIWWTAFQYIYWIALILNVYLFKLRVLSFIAQCAHRCVLRFLFISFCRFYSSLEIFFFLSMNRLILSVTSFQLQLLYSAASLHSVFRIFFLLSFQFVK